jgi:hypothetical protein
LKGRVIHHLILCQHGCKFDLLRLRINDFKINLFRNQLSCRLHTAAYKTQALVTSKVLVKHGGSGYEAIFISTRTRKLRGGIAD